MDRKTSSTRANTRGLCDLVALSAHQAAGLSTDIPGGRGGRKQQDHSQNGDLSGDNLQEDKGFGRRGEAIMSARIPAILGSVLRSTARAIIEIRKNRAETNARLDHIEACFSELEREFMGCGCSEPDVDDPRLAMTENQQRFLRRESI
jgi:hypothetical protein